MTAPVKILAVGAAAGAVRDLFAKIKSIDSKHGKFDIVLCIGDFFGPTASGEDESNDISELLSGQLDVPVHCYIMQGEYPLPASVVTKVAETGGEICKKVYLLGKSTIISTENGVRIACLGGIYDPMTYSTPDSTPVFSSPFFNSKSLDHLLSNTFTQSTKENDTNLASGQSPTSPSQLVDVLVTNLWPEAITQFTTARLGGSELESICSPVLNIVIQSLKPRYHFAAGVRDSRLFWEREPYSWDDEDNRVSRFISLGAFGGEKLSGKKPRWFYAFSFSPNATTTARPSNSTNNPFSVTSSKPAKRLYGDVEGENVTAEDTRQSGKRFKNGSGEQKKPPQGYRCRRCNSTEHFISDCPERMQPPEGYICRICNTPGHLVRDCPTKHAVGDTGGRKPKPGYVCRACGSDQHYLDDCSTVKQQPLHAQGGFSRPRGARRPHQDIRPEECWFCLGNPNIAKHLVVAVGSECYLTLPKGQIVRTQSAASEPSLVPGGGHVLIVPIDHYPTFHAIPPDVADPIVKEMESFKSALRAFYATYGAAAVMFEVGRAGARSVHAHVQSVPLPQTLADQVADAFVREGELRGIDFARNADADAALDMCSGERLGYFRVDLPNQERMVHVMRESVPFSLQFGREVLASLMAMPDRVDWKACMLPDHEDRSDAQAFRGAFARFDPSQLS